MYYNSEVMPPFTAWHDPYHLHHVEEVLPLCLCRRELYFMQSSSILTYQGALTENHMSAQGVLHLCFGSRIQHDVDEWCP